MAGGRMRYCGEPVAVVVAADRYLAEDALELIEVHYAPLPAIVDPLAALDPQLPPLHEGLGGNIASDRSFRYGDPERAFAEAARKVSVSIRYPRNSCTPIETYGIVAMYDPGEDAYDVLANLTAPYDIRHVTGRNRVVLTNKTPTGLNRGFGGPQMYYALERLMQRVAVELKLDPIDVIRRNLVPAKAFPYRTASGTLLDSGDYSHALDVALADG